MKRVCIYPKDVAILTGKSMRHSQKTLQDLRFVLNKNKKQYITIKEFAEHSGIDIKTIQEICLLYYIAIINYAQ